MQQKFIKPDKITIIDKNGKPCGIITRATKIFLYNDKKGVRIKDGRIVEYKENIGWIYQIR